jgi:hypothetical protein
MKRKLYTSFEKKKGFDIERYFTNGKQRGILVKTDFDEAWNYILTHEPNSDKNLPGAFVGWDNTPRKCERGQVYVGDSPEKLEKYMEQQIIRAREVYKKDMIFMYAWNEWAEGGYLEPDERTGYGNLEAIKHALRKTGEFPW